MKVFIQVLVLGSVALVGCKTSSPSSQVKDLGSTGSPDATATLISQLQSISCVQVASADSVVGLASAGSGSGAVGSQTGNVNVVVKDGITAALCANQISAALPTVKILNVMDAIGMISVGPAGSATAGSPAETLAAQLMQVSCVKVASPDTLVGLASVGSSSVGSQTGNVNVVVKDGLSAADCAKQISAALPVQILSILDAVGAISVGPGSAADALVIQLLQVPCVQAASADKLVGLASGGGSGALGSETGAVNVVAKSGISASECAAQISAALPTVQIGNILEGIGALSVTPGN